MLQDNSFYIIAGIVFTLIFGGIGLLWWFFGRKTTSLPSSFSCDSISKITTGTDLTAYKGQFRSDIKWTLAPGSVGANTLTAADASGKVMLGPCPITLTAL